MLKPLEKTKMWEEKDQLENETQRQRYIQAEIAKY